MSQPRVAACDQTKRNRNFQEVSLGYPKKIAIDEAQRCPQCSDPVCKKGCPLGIDIPGFIRLLREGNLFAAYQKIKEKNPFPSICGRICSSPCEAACILNDEEAPIGIRALERFAADFGKVKAVKTPLRPSGKKIAIIGSGPSGLSASVELAQKGYQVTVFEALDRPGGVLKYGIPEFRLPDQVLDNEINEIKNLGVEFKMNFFIGQTMSLADLKDKGFSAILLAMGAGVPKFMDIPGANLGRVYYGEEFLMRVNLAKRKMFSGVKPDFPVGGRVAVIGSGNTALDCARSAKRFGSDITLIFRRTEEEMRVRAEERNFAKEEGIKLEPLVQPLEILSDGDHGVRGVKCLRLDYADADSSGKWVLEAVPDSEFILDVETVIIAVGHQPNSLLRKFEKQLELNIDKTLKIDEQKMTSIPGVFACGNVVTNAGPVVEAIASGKVVAESIHQYLKK